ncbi:MAG: 4Fe-4S binding protein [Anaerolineales bacterium]
MKNTVVVDWEICQNCVVCPPLKECKFRALIRIDSDEPPAIESIRCNGCGKCISLCPYHAIIQTNGYNSSYR